jgi:cyclin H
MKPLRKKLQKCRDPDRADLVALQRAKREKLSAKEKQPSQADADVFGEGDDRDAKRRKLGKQAEVFGPAL